VDRNIKTVRTARTALRTTPRDAQGVKWKKEAAHISVSAKKKKFLRSTETFFSLGGGGGE
jgi:hypothetical protein